ncbi:MAG: hypothetical protein OEV64_10265 [Desulfobulbaceae bacterium]|nr:hypothetical protein [Desulfobulbaceae bacterium]
MKQSSLIFHTWLKVKELVIEKILRLESEYRQGIRLFKDMITVPEHHRFNINPLKIGLSGKDVAFR